MSVALLFESREWSTFALAEGIRRRAPGLELHLYDLEAEVNIDCILAHDLIVSRIFASAQFRGHQRSLSRASEILHRARLSGKHLLNSYEAHCYEVDKNHAAQVMSQHGLPVPEIYACFVPGQGADCLHPAFPCIIKPNCGGRTMDTHVVHTPGELLSLWPRLSPSIRYLAEAYITPNEGFVTRIEVIGGRCVQILRKTLSAGGLAAYRLGSKFHLYPECPLAVQALALRTLALLNIEMGSLDIIESGHGAWVIDVNSVSNTSEDCVEAFGFDLMDATAQYVVSRHRVISNP